MDNQNQKSIRDRILKKGLIFISILFLFPLLILFFNFKKAIPINQLLPITLLFGLFVLIILPIVAYKVRQHIFKHRDKYLKIFIIISVILIIMRIILGMSFSDYFFSIALGLVVIFCLVELSKKNS